MGVRIAGFLIGVILILSACGGTSSPQPTPQPTPTGSPTSPSSRNIPPPATTRLPFEPDIAASGAVTLTVWAPDDFVPGPSAAGQVLQNQIAEFKETHPGVGVVYEQKARYGKGGLVDFMLQVNDLVPNRLPDVAVVDSRELDVLRNARLLQPLSHDLPSGVFSDLFGSAQKIAAGDGSWVDLPASLEVDQLSYDSSAVEQAPSTWDAVIAGKQPFLFAVSDTEVFLFHYLENGGTLSPRTQPALDVSVMATVLSYYSKLKSAKLLPDAALGLKTTDEVWQPFSLAQAPLAQVRAKDYLSETTHGGNSGVAAIPTRDGRATTLAHSWSYVVLAIEPRRHAAAVQLMEWLNDPARIGEWANALRIIPARKSAFPNAIQPGPFADLMVAILDDAIVSPTFDEQAPYLAAWQDAIQTVLRGELAPADAAARAAQAISQ